MMPYPLLSLSLLVMWLLLNDFTLGHLVLGSVVAMFGGWAMASLRPDKPKLKKWYLVPKLLWRVFTDIIRSNAAASLRWRTSQPRPSSFANRAPAPASILNGPCMGCYRSCR